MTIGPSPIGSCAYQWRGNTRFGEDGERGRKKVEKDNENFGFLGIAGIIHPNAKEWRTSMDVFVQCFLRHTNKASIALHCGIGQNLIANVVLKQHVEMYSNTSESDSIHV